MIEAFEGGAVEHLKKGEMAERAQELLAGSGWLPEPLRTHGRAISATPSAFESSQISRIGSASADTPASGDETGIPDAEHPAEHDGALADEALVAAE
jgi:ParB family chromosome partitioning protein